MKTKEDVIKQTLKELAIGPHLTGYFYLQDAISMCVDDKHALNGICKNVYTKIAQAHGVTYSSVERAMRHAAERSVNLMDAELCYELFGNAISHNTYKPSLKCFIGCVAERVVDKLSKEV